LNAKEEEAKREDFEELDTAPSTNAVTTITSAPSFRYQITKCLEDVMQPSIDPQEWLREYSRVGK
jgi:hypothetical protein